MAALTLDEFLRSVPGRSGGSKKSRACSPAAAAAAALLRRETSLTLLFMTNPHTLATRNYDNCTIFALKTNHVNLPACNIKTQNYVRSQLILNSSFSVTSRARHGSGFDNGHLVPPYDGTKSHSRQIRALWANPRTGSPLSRA
jgi:hypothetical protein